LSALVFARIIHVLSVVIWIGGVAFVTTVLIPAIRRHPSESERIELFEQFEARFALQARMTTLLAGASGFYLLHGLGAWARYLDPAYWWVHLMTFVWLVFTVVLFALEPLFLHRLFVSRAKKSSDRAFGFLQTMHWVLLTLSLVAITGAVAGTRGYLRL
jgi:uncharacterized membrane protein